MAFCTGKSLEHGDPGANLSADALGTALGAILRGTSDYLSHASALYVLGLSDRRPERWSVTSSGRRRPRKIDGRPLTFVFHPADRHRELVQKLVGRERLQVSSLEQTLVDILSDLHLLESPRSLPGWFAELPYRLSPLISLARQVGETPLRRTLFWAILTGRAAWEDIPEDFSQAPAHLFPAKGLPSSAGSSDQVVWEGRLRLLFPREVLSWPRSRAFISGEAEEEWQELLHHPPLRSRQHRSGRLLIRRDPRPESRQWLEEFFLEESERLWSEDPSALLRDLFARQFSEPSSGHCPRLLLTWILDRIANTPSWERHITRGVKRLLASRAPFDLEAGMYHSCRQGRLDPALSALSGNILSLFQAGRFRAIAFVCKQALLAGRPLPADLRNIYARSLSAMSQNHEALLVTRPSPSRNRNTRRDLREQGDLAYTSAVIHLQNTSLEEAVRELFTARDCFTSLKDEQRLGKVWIVSGNIDAARGLYSQARNWYRKALGPFKTAGNHDVLAMLFNNLGFVEFRSGRYHQAERLLKKARATGRNGRNPLVEATSLVTQGKVALASGNPGAALLLVTEAHDLQTARPGTGCPEETAALAAWSCELQGLAAAAVPWWEKTKPTREHPLPRSSSWVIESCGVMGHLLRGDLPAAHKGVQSLVRLSGSGHLPPDDLAFTTYLEGMAALAAGSGKAFEHFLQAERQTPGENTVRKQHATLMAFLSFPSPGLEASAKTALLALTAGRFHDPLWLLYADRLMNPGLPHARPFLLKLLRQTSPALLRETARRFPGLRRLARRVGTMGVQSVLTFIRNGAAAAFSPRQRESWLARDNRRCFRFDGPSGELRWGDSRTVLSPGTHPHGILVQLLASCSRSLSIPALYRSVWGGEFDPECDVPSVKSALSRLRKALGSGSPRFRLALATHSDGPATVSLELNGPWECVF